MPITRRSLTFGMPLSAAASVMTRHARGADTSPILIGYPAALTGPSSAPGVGQNRGVTYIVEQINAAGGVKGRKIEMVTRDTQGDPTKAVNAAQELMANFRRCMRSAGRTIRASRWPRRRSWRERRSPTCTVLW